MKVIREGQMVHMEKLFLDYEYADMPGAGWSPPCNEQGIITDDCPEGHCAMGDPVKHVEMLNGMLSKIVETGKLDGHQLTYKGIGHNQWKYWEPKVIECENRIWRKKTRISEYCGAEVVLDNLMFNTCPKCHTDYSQSGQRLAKREQWGWDTGETFSDIAQANVNLNDHDAIERIANGEDY